MEILMRARLAVVSAAAAGLLVGGLAVTGAQAASQNDTDCRKVAAAAQPASGVNSAEVLEYVACRADRQDEAIKALGATTPAPSASPTVTSPVTSTPSGSPTPTVAPTPTVTPTSTPSPTPSPTSAADFPTAATTGVPAGTTLSAYTGPATITTAGTVIDGKTINACIVIKANNVTIKRSKFTNTGCYWQVLNDSGNTGLVLTDVELTSGADATVAGDNYMLTRANVHGSVDGLKAGTNVVVQDSYLHDFAISSDSHNDGIQSLGTTSLKILRNRIVMADGATSAVILSTGSAGAMRNVQIDGNLLGGGAFTVYGGYQSGTDDKSKVSNIAVTNNHFTTAVFPRSGAYGPLTSTDSPVVVSGNTWYDGPNKGKPVG